jgi:uracil-DNA glycosylase
MNAFLQPEGPCPAKIMIVGEFPAEIEVSRGQVFIGNAGKELSNLLAEAGIIRSECFLTYALQARPPEGDIGAYIALKKKDITPFHKTYRGKSVLPTVWESLDILKRQIELCQPNIIIALGNIALWSLTGEWGADKWRGSLLTTSPDLALALPNPVKVIPTYAVSRLFAEWDKRQILLRDLRRAKTHRDYPEVIPVDYKFLLAPTFPQAVAYLSALIRSADRGPLKLAIDIETCSGHMTCIGVAWSKTEAFCVPLTCEERPSGYWPAEEEGELVHLLYLLLTHKNLIGIGQNFLYDAQYILRHWHFTPRIARDTMIAQHSLFSNMPKGLDFLASMYCEDYRYWKDMHHTPSGKVAE